MASAQRREREKANLRRAILDAARELFVTEGYQAVSMRRIANKIEYSPTAIYLYFRDKEEIFLHLVEEGFQILAERLEALDIADPIERLREGGRVYLDFALTQSHYYKIMFELGDKEWAEERCKGELEIAQRTFGFIRTCVTQAQEQGVFRSDVSEILVSHAIWASVHGVVSLTLAGRLHMLPEEAQPALFATVVEMVARGFIRPM